MAAKRAEVVVASRVALEMPVAASAARACAWRDSLATSVKRMSGKLNSISEDRSFDAFAMACRAAVLALNSRDKLRSSAFCLFAVLLPKERHLKGPPARVLLVPTAPKAPTDPRACGGRVWRR